MIWLVGSGGMLGSEVAQCLARQGTRFIASDLDVGITDSGAIRAFLENESISWIVNCAAYTAVDRAESEEDMARRINAGGAANLAAVAVEQGAALLHISTDYVFDGTKAGPYLEDDPVNPAGAYGRTKMEGELAVRDALRRHIIIRTAWLYGVNGPNFVTTMLRLFSERDAVGVVDDQRGSPTCAVDLAESIAEIVSSPVTEDRWGTYHFTNNGETTWFGFAQEIYSQAHALGSLDSSCAIRPITTAEYPLPAPRPANSVLDNTKIERAFGFGMRDWKDALHEYLRGIKE